MEIAALALATALAVLTCAITPGVAQDGDAVAFDIPAQPVASALEAFSLASGYHVLMSDAGVRRSSAVKGTLDPRQALAQLKAGTDLTVRFTADDAVVVMLDPRAEAATRSVAPPRTAQATARFDAMLQNAVFEALCQTAITRPGSYRAALDLWVSRSGQIERAALLASTGDSERDSRILAALRTISMIEQPPAQPTTVLITRAGGACSSPPVEHAGLR